MPQIHPFSTSTLRLDIHAEGDEPCGYATGLLINSGGRVLLATNWHVVTGRHPFTGQLNSLAAQPQHLVIWHPVVDHRSSHLGIRAVREPLFDGRGNQRWIEPPTRSLSSFEDSRLAIDVVFLPLVNTNDCVTNLGFAWTSRNVEPEVEPGSPVSIVGYPRRIMGVVNYFCKHGPVNIAICRRSQRRIAAERISS